MPRSDGPTRVLAVLVPAKACGVGAPAGRGVPIRAAPLRTPGRREGPRPAVLVSCVEAPGPGPPASAQPLCSSVASPSPDAGALEGSKPRGSWVGDSSSRLKQHSGLRGRLNRPLRPAVPTMWLDASKRGPPRAPDPCGVLTYLATSLSPPFSLPAQGRGGVNPAHLPAL